MCVFETVGLGGGNFYVSYAIPSGAYSSYTHDCVDNALWLSLALDPT